MSMEACVFPRPSRLKRNAHKPEAQASPLPPACTPSVPATWSRGPRTLSADWGEPGKLLEACSVVQCSVSATSTRGFCAPQTLGTRPTAATLRPWHRGSRDVGAQDRSFPKHFPRLGLTPVWKRDPAVTQTWKGERSPPATWVPNQAVKLFGEF